MPLNPIVDTPENTRHFQPMHAALEAPILADSLRARIHSGIEQYRQRHPLRSKSAHRIQSIERIYEICRNAQGDEQLLEALEDYFISEDFYCGPWDRSILEECIVAAIAAGTDIEAPFGFYPPNQPSINRQAQETITIAYELADFVEYAIDKYVQQTVLEEKPYRSDDITRIRNILAQENTPEEKAEALSNYLNSPSFTRSFNSQLKKYLLSALKYAAETERQVAIRPWALPSVNDENPPAKILIYVHGWHDSLNSAEPLAKEALKHGYTVIAYDNRGHGRDAERAVRGISTDKLRIDFRKFLKHVHEHYPEASIALAGHSMGGAILTTEKAFIERQEYVKSVSLIAPAVMSSFGRLISPVKIFYRNMHADVLNAQRASDRFGGSGPSLFGLLRLMREASRALLALFSGVSRVSWKVYAGRKDISVNYREFEDLPEAQHVRFFARADHAMHVGHHRGSINRNILADMNAAMQPADELNARSFMAS
ncbi:short chain dehydrogenase [Legionella geestiana]|uniref:Short chain dehydrogenase n=1 Tax=Legionella geestiana TaxID=45065 RepID=A0A0W0TSF1_9GAMM|nr:alpha/beta fold hydrolase [Legionella geestiana]KTC98521.1 short chain dehydrogenase [Legionella geestiana]QBS13077.1 alpha/beta fold hydrolase [Legionella geestiana]STX54409.1 acetoin dehydrogenase E2 subunit dihydrolipoyllysine-residue acetyltransferase [Legionella geestiana]